MFCKANMHGIHGNQFPIFISFKLNLNKTIKYFDGQFVVQCYLENSSTFNAVIKQREFEALLNPYPDGINVKSSSEEEPPPRDSVFQVLIFKAQIMTISPLYRKYIFQKKIVSKSYFSVSMTTFARVFIYYARKQFFEPKYASLTPYCDYFQISCSLSRCVCIRNLTK